MIVIDLTYSPPVTKEKPEVVDLTSPSPSPAPKDTNPTRPANARVAATTNLVSPTTEVDEKGDEFHRTRVVSAAKRNLNNDMEKAYGAGQEAGPSTQRSTTPMAPPAAAGTSAAVQQEGAVVNGAAATRHTAPAAPSAAAGTAAVVKQEGAVARNMAASHRPSGSSAVAGTTAAVKLEGAVARAAVAPGRAAPAAPTATGGTSEGNAAQALASLLQALQDLEGGAPGPAVNGVAVPKRADRQ